MTLLWTTTGLGTKTDVIALVMLITSPSTSSSSYLSCNEGEVLKQLDIHGMLDCERPEVLYSQYVERRQIIVLQTSKINELL